MKAHLFRHHPLHKNPIFFFLISPKLKTFFFFKRNLFSLNLIPAERLRIREREMEEEVKRLSKSLGGFCNHLQSSCDAFNQSLTRRPIPLGLFLSLLSFPLSH